MFLNNNKRKIAIFVLFFFMFSFPIKLKESYANPVALEVVMWGVAAVLTAAGIMVDTGDTESLMFAVDEYWNSLKAPEKAMYERMAQEAAERGNAALSDQLWNKANSYVNSIYNEGLNTYNNLIINPSDGKYKYFINGDDIYDIYLDNENIGYMCQVFWRKNGIKILGSYSMTEVTEETLERMRSSHMYLVGNELHAILFYGTNKIRSDHKTLQLIDGYYGYREGKEVEITFTQILPEEFNYSTPVPPGTVPERRIAYPSHVFNPNNDIDGILEPLTGKTAQDIWGAAGAYTANTTTFDPVSGDNPILPWVPIADPSTFTPAGELPAEISATAPGVLDGTNSDLNSISGSLGSIWDILKTGFNALIDTIWTGISHLLDGLGSISLLLKSVFDLINSGISALVGAISSIWDLVYDGFASVATALRGILDQVANVAGYLNPASDTFFLRTALVPDVAVLNGFVESLNINFQEKFQIAAAYEEFQSYKDTDHESEFEDIYVDLPIWGMQCICKGEFVNTAGQQFKSVVAAFLIMLTVIFCFKRIATIGSK